jgi:hypothetical protein
VAGWTRCAEPCVRELRQLVAPFTVRIPFAEVVASHVKTECGVRIRRDSSTMFMLTQAHAILHADARVRLEGGELVATFEDYAAAHELATEVFAAGLGAAVPPAVRSAVDALPPNLEHARGLSFAELGRLLQVDKKTARARMEVAIDAGWAIDLADRGDGEGHRGRPARLVKGEEMPEDLTVFPSVDELRGGDEDEAWAELARRLEPGEDQ